MLVQSQILHTLSDAQSLGLITKLLDEKSFESRTALARRVCKEFNFKDSRGQLQVSSCLKALKTLARTSNYVVLPPSHKTPISSTPCRFDERIALAHNVPLKLNKVQDLVVFVVKDRQHRCIWNTMIADEHPQGMTIFSGCQLRYLVHSRHGYLGAAGFSSAALQLSARDHWMGWSRQQRHNHLNRVLCLSRFLIRPNVHCKNLASHILGRILRDLPHSFKSRYGYAPWLVETFVNPLYDGSSLRASNFLAIGQTVGRGRQDRSYKCDKTVKSVYMYELDSTWRRRLGVPFVSHAPCLEPGEGLNSEQWAKNEFGGAMLGDKRLTARLVKSASLLATYPGRAIHGKSSDVDGYYRFIEKPEDSLVTVKNILSPHRQRSIQRIRSQDTVLCIQDGTDLNFATRPNCEGLGIIGRNQTSVVALGLHLHTTLAVTVQGLPLGVLRCAFDPVPKKDQKRHNEKRTELRWLNGYKDVMELTRSLTQKNRIISVMDREADFFELFDEQRRQKRVDVLVRAQHDRCLNRKGKKLFATMSSGDVNGHIDIEVQGLTERKKPSGKLVRPMRQKRLAQCELRFSRVTLPPTIKGREPIEMSGIHVVEIQPPEGQKAIQWYLLTSLHVNKVETAAKIVGYYLQRWKVEDFFRVLKSGCRAEFLAFRTADRLQRAIAINSVIAWRIMVMTLLGRQVPECSSDLMFTEHELRFLHDYAEKHRLLVPSNLGETVRLVAHLGGYRNRKSDLDPGHQVMWRGYNMLSNATLGYCIGFESGKKYALKEAPAPI